MTGIGKGRRMSAAMPVGRNELIKMTVPTISQVFTMWQVLFVYRLIDFSHSCVKEVVFAHEAQRREGKSPNER